MHGRRHRRAGGASRRAPRGRALVVGARQEGLAVGQPRAGGDVAGVRVVRLQARAALRVPHLHLARARARGPVGLRAGGAAARPAAAWHLTDGTPPSLNCVWPPDRVFEVCACYRQLVANAHGSEQLAQKPLPATAATVRTTNTAGCPPSPPDRFRLMGPARPRLAARGPGGAPHCRGRRSAASCRPGSRPGT